MVELGFEPWTHSCRVYAQNAQFHMVSTARRANNDNSVRQASAGTHTIQWRQVLDDYDKPA